MVAFLAIGGRIGSWKKRVVDLQSWCQGQMEGQMKRSAIMHESSRLVGACLKVEIEVLGYLGPLTHRHGSKCAMLVRSGCGNRQLDHVTETTSVEAPHAHLVLQNDLPRGEDMALRSRPREFPLSSSDITAGPGTLEHDHLLQTGYMKSPRHHTHKQSHVFT